MAVTPMAMIASGKVEPELLRKGFLKDVVLHSITRYIG
jgi:hypothetical protein